MRLLRTDLSAGGHLQLCNFVGGHAPRYAILSHTWGQGEITLQDVEAGRGLGSPGYEKATNCCARAKADGFDYVWIDTCCIDKTSSAELSEAINSMYWWYQDAEICYAYLADILSSGHGTYPLATNAPSLAVSMGGQPQVPFTESRWFTRGWTLQELIAPSEIIFVDQQWDNLGTKTTLQRPISARTGIPASILAGDGGGLGTASVAQKMSWAAKRQTTRGEDTAYCLLGIFGVNMPLLYGEGERAFIRLQEEITKITDDQSLFAWRSDDCRGGLLATSPAAFHRSGDIVPRDLADSNNEPVTISNKGVRITLPIIGLGDNGLALGALSCGYSSASNTGRVGVYLRDALLTMENFERVHSRQLVCIDVANCSPSHRQARRIYAKLGRLQNGRKMAHEPTLEPRFESGIPNVAMERRIRLALRGDRSVRNSPQTRAHLFKASMEGDDEEICRLLGSGLVSAEARDDGGKTALIHAAQSGCMSTVWLLLTRSDVEVDSADKTGLTALFYAAGAGHKDTVRVLLARNPRLVSSGGRKLLSYAAEAGQESVVRLLVDTGRFEPDLADLCGMRPLDYAVKMGHTGVATALVLTARVDVYERTNGQDLLGWAIESQGWDLVRSLLSTADLVIEVERKHGSYGRTPLAQAVAMEQEWLIDWLLDKPIDVNTRDKDDMTPLAIAVPVGNLQIANKLLQRGAEVYSQSLEGDGTAPLILAAKKQDASMVKLLIEHVRHQEQRRAISRCLSLAIENGHELSVRILLGKGANINGEGEDLSPLSVAVQHHQEPMVRLLLDMGAKVDEAGSFTWPPIVQAIHRRNEPIFRLLLARGAEFKPPTCPIDCLRRFMLLQLPWELEQC